MDSAKRSEPEPIRQVVGFQVAGESHSPASVSLQGQGGDRSGSESSLQPIVTIPPAIRSQRGSVAGQHSDVSLRADNLSGDTPGTPTISRRAPTTVTGAGPGPGPALPPLAPSGNASTQDARSRGPSRRVSVTDGRVEDGGASRRSSLGARPGEDATSRRRSLQAERGTVSPAARVSNVSNSHDDRPPSPPAASAAGAPKPDEGGPAGTGKGGSPGTSDGGQPQAKAPASRGPSGDAEATASSRGGDKAPAGKRDGAKGGGGDAGARQGRDPPPQGGRPQPPPAEEGKRHYKDMTKAERRALQEAQKAAKAAARAEAEAAKGAAAGAGKAGAGKAGEGKPPPGRRASQSGSLGAAGDASAGKPAAGRGRQTETVTRTTVDLFTHLEQPDPTLVERLIDQYDPKVDRFPVHPEWLKMARDTAEYKVSVPPPAEADGRGPRVRPRTKRKRAQNPRVRNVFAQVVFFPPRTARAPPPLPGPARPRLAGRQRP